ncbi:MAG: hypothetical protein K6E89_06515 [Sphaerochaetaceae bacterium]|nr:hypothetical protein [Sphaerochaetaceae bacterium]
MRRVLFVLLLVLVAGAFVSCDLDNLFSNEETESQTLEEGDLTVYNSLPADTKAAVDKIGAIYGMYAPDSENGARFINGQKLTDNFRDENGNPMPLEFNSWLIGYKNILGWVPTIFDRAPVNAMFHNSHGYDLRNLPKGLSYLEFSEYRYLESNEHHMAGEICFIELRLLCDEVSSKHYYCKSLKFDPTLRYEISSFGLDLLTGKYVSYNYDTRETGPASQIKVYDDEGVLIEVIYINDEGDFRGKRVYEYNSNGFTTKTTYYNATGRKFCESYYPGLFQGREQYTIYFDENGTAYEKRVYQYAQDGKTVIKEAFFDLSDSPNRLTSESYILKKDRTEYVDVYYDELGNPESQWERIGEIRKEILFYPSGHIKQFNEYDEEMNLLSSPVLFDDGNVHRIEVDSLDDSLETEAEISFTTANPEYSIYLPVHLALGIDPSNMVIEIFAVDNEGNELELDDSEYSIKFFGEDETVDISGEGSLVYRVPSDKWLESINVNLVKNENIEATLKIKVNNNVILMGTPDKFSKIISYGVPDAMDQSFFIDFSGEDPVPINVSTNDIFWYVVLKDEYSSDLSLLDAVLALEDLVEISGVDASYDSETCFYPTSKGNSFKLVVETSGEGSADHDLAVYFIYAQYNGLVTKNVTELSVSDVEELVRVPLVFYK